METSEESVTGNLATDTAAVESGVKGCDFEPQKDNMKVEGSDSADGPVVDVFKNDVEVKQEVQNMNGLEGGEEAEMEIDNSNSPVVNTEVVLLEEIKQEEVEEMNELEGVNEADKQIDTDLVIENVEESRDGENRVQENVDGEKSDDSDEGEQEHEFAVGDFVWGKVKSYPWWPGQIYDPSDASDCAKKERIAKGSFLVAYFEDDSFSWCHKYQLKRFVDNFDELSIQSNSDKFIGAVAEALSEFILFLEVEICGMCPHLETHIWDFKAKNRGIRAGVSVPRGDYLKLFLARLESKQLLENLRHVAKGGSVDSLLEFQVLRSWLAAFLYTRRGYALVEFHEAIPIEGLEDMTGNGVNGEADIIETTDEKIENDVNSSVKMSTGKRGRKKKAETMNKSLESVKNGDFEKGERDGKEETLKKSLPLRARKKSKFLSPPYTPPKVATAKIGERMTIFAGQLVGSTPISTSCSNQSNKKRSKQVDNDIDVKEVLSVMAASAVDPLHARGTKNLDQITEFVSAFRRSVHSDRTKESKEGNVSLIITFPPSFPLPSKDKLLETFGKYGEINETGTDVFPNSFSARIAFVRNHDAEEARSECLKNSPFENANVGYRLLYDDRKETAGSTGIGLISQRLEKLTSEVKSWDGQVTGKMKRKLEGELKDIIVDVSVLPESSMQ